MLVSEFSFVLKPSPLGGVGVFAAHDIPPGSLVFDQDFDLRTMKVKDIPAEFIKYCIYLNDDYVICPTRFDHMEIGWFINHSDTPNIDREISVRNRNSGPETIHDLKIRSVYTTKHIKAGEEILMDYNRLNEPEHLKESYFKPHR